MDRARLERLNRITLIDLNIRLQERIALLEAQVAGPRPAGRLPDDQPVLLTERQREVVVLIAQGLSNAEIAAQLTLTPGTVGNHIAQITKKLGARGRVAVAAWAFKQGLV
jgi:DNA-binding NarL/FixJ family response regulator